MEPEAKPLKKPEILPQDLFQKLMKENNLTIKFTSLNTRPLQDGALIVEMPSLIVEYGKNVS